MSKFIKTVVITTLIAISSSAVMAAQSSGRGGRGGGGGNGGSDPDEPLSYGCLTHGYGCNKDKPVYVQNECSSTRVLEQIGYNTYRWVYRCEVPRKDIF